MYATTPPAPGLFAAETAFHIPQHVVHRSFVSETVMLNLMTGKYYGVNTTGGRMLEALETGCSIQDAAELLGAEFDVSVDQLVADLLEFCEDLVERGLLEVAGARPEVG